METAALPKLKTPCLQPHLLEGGKTHSLRRAGSYEEALRNEGLHVWRDA